MLKKTMSLTLTFLILFESTVFALPKDISIRIRKEDNSPYFRLTLVEKEAEQKKRVIFQEIFNPNGNRGNKSGSFSLSQQRGGFILKCREKDDSFSILFTKEGKAEIISMNCSTRRLFLKTFGDVCTGQKALKIQNLSVRAKNFTNNTSILAHSLHLDLEKDFITIQSGHLFIQKEVHLHQGHFINQGHLHGEEGSILDLHGHDLTNQYLRQNRNLDYRPRVTSQGLFSILNGGIVRNEADFQRGQAGFCGFKIQAQVLETLPLSRFWDIDILDLSIETESKNRGLIQSHHMEWTGGNLLNFGKIKAQTMRSIFEKMVQHKGQWIVDDLSLQTPIFANKGLVDTRQFQFVIQEKLENMGLIWGRDKGVIQGDAQISNDGIIEGGAALEIYAQALSSRYKICSTYLTICLQDELHNFGKMKALETLFLSSPRITNKGYIQAKEGMVSVSHALKNDVSFSGQKFSFLGQGSVNNAGQIMAKEEASFFVSDLINSGNIETHHLRGKLSAVFHNEGTIKGCSAEVFSPQGDNDGTLSFAQDLKWSGDYWTSTEKVLAKKMTFVLSHLFNNLGAMESDYAVVQAYKIKNTGHISSEKSGDFQALKKIKNTGKIDSKEYVFLLSQKIVNKKNISGDNLHVCAAELDNNGDIISQQDMLLEIAKNILNKKKIESMQGLCIMGRGSIDQNGDLLSKKILSIQTENTLSNRGNINGEQIDLWASTVQNHHQIKATDWLTIHFLEKLTQLEEGTLSAQRADIFGSGKMINGGAISVNTLLRIQADDLDNTKNIEAPHSLIQIRQKIMNKGNISGDDIHVCSAYLDNSGEIISQQDMLLEIAKKLENDKKIESMNNLCIIGRGSIEQNGDLLSKKILSMIVSSFSSRGHTESPHIFAQIEKSFSHYGTLKGQCADFYVSQGDNNGTLSFAQYLKWSGGSWTSTKHVEAQKIKFTLRHLFHNFGVMEGEKTVVQASEIKNTGSLFCEKTGTFRSVQKIENTGQIMGKTNSPEQISLLSQEIENKGMVEALLLSAEGLLKNESRGVLHGIKHLLLKTTGDSYSQGKLLSKEKITLEGKKFDSSGDIFSPLCAVQLTEHFDNDGHICVGKLSVLVPLFDNRRKIAGKNAQEMIYRGQKINNTGTIKTEKLIQIFADEMESSGKMGTSFFEAIVKNKIKSEGNISGDNLHLWAAELDNSGDIISQQDMLLEISKNLLNQKKIEAMQDLCIMGRGSIDQNGDLLSKKLLLIQTENTLSNRGKINGEQIDLWASKVRNHKLIKATDWLTIHFLENLTQLKEGALSAQKADLFGPGKMTNGGAISIKELLRIQADDLDNAGNILVPNSLLQIRQKVTNKGNILGDDIHVCSENLDNSGEIISQQDMLLEISKNLLNQKKIESMQDLCIIGRGSIDQNGDLLSKKILSMIASSLTSRGKIEAPHILVHMEKTLSNYGKLDGRQIDLFAYIVENHNLIKAVNKLKIHFLKTLTQAKGGTLSAQRADIFGPGNIINGGTISVKELLSIQANDLDSSGDVDALNLVLQLQKNLINRGNMQALQRFFIEAEYVQNLKEMEAEEDFFIQSKRLKNKGTIQSTRLLTLKMATTLKNLKKIDGKTVVFEGGYLDNDKDAEILGSSFTALCRKLRNQGALKTDGLISLKQLAEGLDNSGVILSENGGVEIESSQIIKNTSIIEGRGGAVSLRMDQLENTGGINALSHLLTLHCRQGENKNILLGGKGVTLDVTQRFENKENGQIESGENFTLQGGGKLINRADILVKQDVTALHPVDNRGNILFTGKGTFSDIENTGVMGSQEGAATILIQKGTNKGTFRAQKELTMGIGESLDSCGHVFSNERILFEGLGNFTNQKEGSVFASESILFSGLNQLNNGGSIGLFQEEKKIQKTKQIHLKDIHSFSGNGQILGEKKVWLQNIQDVNTQNTIWSDNLLSIENCPIFFNGGLVSGKNQTAPFIFDSFKNSGKLQMTQGNLSLSVAEFENNGIILTPETLSLILRNHKKHALNKSDLQAKTFKMSGDNIFQNEKTILVERLESTNTHLLNEKDGFIGSETNNVILDINDCLNKGQFQGNKSLTVIVNNRLESFKKISSLGELLFKGKGALVHHEKAKIIASQKIQFETISVDGRGKIRSGNEVIFRDIATPLTFSSTSKVWAEGALSFLNCPILLNGGLISGKTQAAPFLFEIFKNTDRLGITEGDLTLSVADFENEGVILTPQILSLILRTHKKNAVNKSHLQAKTLKISGKNTFENQKIILIEDFNASNTLFLNDKEGFVGCEKGDANIVIKKGTNKGIFQAEKNLSLTTEEFSSNENQVIANSINIFGPGLFSNEKELNATGSILFKEGRFKNNGDVRGESVTFVNVKAKNNHKILVPGAFILKDSALKNKSHCQGDQSIELKGTSTLTQKSGSQFITFGAFAADPLASLVLEKDSLLFAEKDMILDGESYTLGGEIRTKGSIRFSNCHTLTILPEGMLIAEMGEIIFPKLKKLICDGFISGKTQSTQFDFALFKNSGRFRLTEGDLSLSLTEFENGGLILTPKTLSLSLRKHTRPAVNKDHIQANTLKILGDNIFENQKTVLLEDLDASNTLFINGEEGFIGREKGDARIFIKKGENKGVFRAQNDLEVSIGESLNSSGYVNSDERILVEGAGIFTLQKNGCVFAPESIVFSGLNHVENGGCIGLFQEEKTTQKTKKVELKDLGSFSGDGKIFARHSLRLENIQKFTSQAQSEFWSENSLSIEKCPIFFNGGLVAGRIQAAPFLFEIFKNTDRLGITEGDLTISVADFENEGTILTPQILSLILGNHKKHAVNKNQLQAKTVKISGKNTFENQKMILIENFDASNTFFLNDQEGFVGCEKGDARIVIKKGTNKGIFQAEKNLSLTTGEFLSNENQVIANNINIFGPGLFSNEKELKATGRILFKDGSVKNNGDITGESVTFVNVKAENNQNILVPGAFVLENSALENKDHCQGDQSIHLKGTSTLTQKSGSKFITFGTFTADPLVSLVLEENALLFADQGMTLDGESYTIGGKLQTKGSITFSHCRTLTILPGGMLIAERGEIFFPKLTTLICDGFISGKTQSTQFDFAVFKNSGRLQLTEGDLTLSLTKFENGGAILTPKTLSLILRKHTQSAVNKNHIQAKTLKILGDNIFENQETILIEVLESNNMLNEENGFVGSQTNNVTLDINYGVNKGLFQGNKSLTVNIKNHLESFKQINSLGDLILKGAGTLVQHEKAEIRAPQSLQFETITVDNSGAIYSKNELKFSHTSLKFLSTSKVWTEGILSFLGCPSLFNAGFLSGATQGALFIFEKLKNSGMLQITEGDLSLSVAEFENGGGILTPNILSLILRKHKNHAVNKAHLQAKTVKISGDNIFKNEKMIIIEELVSSNTQLINEEKGLIGSYKNNVLLTINDGINKGQFQGNELLTVIVNNGLESFNQINSLGRLLIKGNKGNSKIVQHDKAQIMASQLIHFENSTVDNRGTIYSKNELKFSKTALTFSATSKVWADGTLSFLPCPSFLNAGFISGASLVFKSPFTNEKGGQIQSLGDMEFEIDGVGKNSGTIVGTQKIHGSCSDFQNNEKMTASSILLRLQKGTNMGEYIAENDLNFQIGHSFTNKNALITKTGKMDIVGPGLFTNEKNMTAMGSLLFKEGILKNNGDISGQSVTFVNLKAENNHDIKVPGAFVLENSSLDNRGHCQGDQLIRLKGTSSLTQKSGVKFITFGSFTAEPLASLALGANSLLFAEKEIILQGGTYTLGGEIRTKGSITFSHCHTLTILPGALLIAEGGEIFFPKLTKLICQGKILSQKALTLPSLSYCQNKGLMWTQGLFTLTTHQLINEAEGKDIGLIGESGLTIKSLKEPFKNKAPIVSKDGEVIITSSHSLDNEDTIYGNKKVMLTVPTVTNNGELGSNGNILMEGITKLQNKKVIAGDGGVTITATNAIINELNNLKDDLKSGIYSTNGSIILTAPDIQSPGCLSALKIHINTKGKPFCGAPLSQGDLQITVPQGWQCPSDFYHQGDLTIVGPIDKKTGSIQSTGNLKWTSPTGFNGLFSLHAGNQLNLIFGQNVTNNTRLIGEQGFSLIAPHFTNAGVLYSGGDALFHCAKGWDQKGHMEIVRAMTLTIPNGSVIFHPGSRFKQRSSGVQNKISAPKGNILALAGFDVHTYVTLEGNLAADCQIFKASQSEEKKAPITGTFPYQILETGKYSKFLGKYNKGLHNITLQATFQQEIMPTGNCSVHLGGVTTIQGSHFQVIGSTFSVGPSFQFTGQHVNVLSPAYHKHTQKVKAVRTKKKWCTHRPDNTSEAKQKPATLYGQGSVIFNLNGHIFQKSPYFLAKPPIPSPAETRFYQKAQVMVTKRRIIRHKKPKRKEVIVTQEMRYPQYVAQYKEKYLNYPQGISFDNTGDIRASHISIKAPGVGSISFSPIVLGKKISPQSSLCSYMLPQELNGKTKTCRVTSPKTHAFQIVPILPMVTISNEGINEIRQNIQKAQIESPQSQEKHRQEFLSWAIEELKKSYRQSLGENDPIFREENRKERQKKSQTVTRKSLPHASQPIIEKKIEKKNEKKSEEKAPQSLPHASQSQSSKSITRYEKKPEKNQKPLQIRFSSMTLAQKKHLREEYKLIRQNLPHILAGSPIFYEPKENLFEGITSKSLLQVPYRIAVEFHPRYHKDVRMQHHPYLLADLMTRSMMDHLKVGTISRYVQDPLLLLRILETEGYLEACRLHRKTPQPIPSNWDEMTPKEQLASQLREIFQPGEVTAFKNPTVVYRLIESYGELVLSAVATFPDWLRNTFQSAFGRLACHYLSLHNTQGNMTITHPMITQGGVSIQTTGNLAIHKPILAEKTQIEAGKNTDNFSSVVAKKFLHVNAGGDVINRITVYQQGEKRPDMNPSLFAGGSGILYKDGSGVWRYLGLSIEAGGEIVNVGSGITSEGDIFLKAPKGVEHRTIAISYISKKETKKSFFKKKKTITYSNAIQEYTLLSTNGRTIHEISEGGLDYYGGKSVGKDLDYANVKGPILYHPVITKDKTVTKTSAWGGLSKSSYKKTEEHANITQLINQTGVYHKSATLIGGTIQAMTPDLIMEAPRGQFTDAILHHSEEFHSRSLLPTFFGSKMLLEGHSPKSLFGDLNCSNLGNLGQSSDKVQMLMTGIKAASELWKKAAGFSEALLQDKLGVFGLTQIADVGISYSETSQKRRWTTSEPCVFQGKRAIFRFSEGLEINGGPLFLGHELIQFDTPFLTLSKALETSHMKQSSTSAQVSYNAMSNSVSASFNYQQSSINTKTYRNALIRMAENGVIDLCHMKGLNLDGATIKAGTVMGSVEKVTMRSYQDEMHASSFGFGLQGSAQSIGGSFSVGKSDQYITNQVSGISDKHGLKNLHIGSLSVNGPHLDPTLDSRAKKVTFVPIYDHKKSSAFHMGLSNLDISSGERFLESFGEGVLSLGAGLAAAKLTQILWGNEFLSTAVGTLTTAMVGYTLTNNEEKEDNEDDEKRDKGAGFETFGEIGYQRNQERLEVLGIHLFPEQLVKSKDSIFNAVEKIFKVSAPQEQGKKEEIIEPKIKEVMEKILEEKIKERIELRVEENIVLVMDDIMDGKQDVDDSPPQRRRVETQEPREKSREKSKQEPRKETKKEAEKETQKMSSLPPLYIPETVRIPLFAQDLIERAPNLTMAQPKATQDKVTEDGWLGKTKKAIHNFFNYEKTKPQDNVQGIQEISESSEITERLEQKIEENHPTASRVKDKQRQHTEDLYDDIEKMNEIIRDPRSSWTDYAYARFAKIGLEESLHNTSASVSQLDFYTHGSEFSKKGCSVLAGYMAGEKISPSDLEELKYTGKVAGMAAAMTLAAVAGRKVLKYARNKINRRDGEVPLFDINRNSLKNFIRDDTGSVRIPFVKNSNTNFWTTATFSGGLSLFEEVPFLMAIHRPDRWKKHSDGPFVINAHGSRTRNLVQLTHAVPLHKGALSQANLKILQREGEVGLNPVQLGRFIVTAPNYNDKHLHLFSCFKGGVYSQELANRMGVPVSAFTGVVGFDYRDARSFSSYSRDNRLEIITSYPQRGVKTRLKFRNNDVSNTLSSFLWNDSGSVKNPFMGTQSISNNIVKHMGEKSTKINFVPFVDVSSRKRLWDTATYGTVRVNGEWVSGTVIDKHFKRMGSRDHELIDIKNNYSNFWTHSNRGSYVFVSHGGKDGIYSRKMESKYGKGFSSLGNSFPFRIEAITVSDPRTMAKLIKSDPAYKRKQPVTLLTCYGGGEECGQNLANSLNAIVDAPTGVVNVLENGQIELPWKNTEFKRFYPQTGKKKEKLGISHSINSFLSDDSGSVKNPFMGNEPSRKAFKNLEKLKSSPNSDWTYQDLVHIGKDFGIEAQQKTNHKYLKFSDGTLIGVSLNQKVKGGQVKMFVKKIEEMYQPRKTSRFMDMLKDDSGSIKNPFMGDMELVDFKKINTNRFQPRRPSNRNDILFVKGFNNGRSDQPVYGAVKILGEWRVGSIIDPQTQSYSWGAQDFELAKIRKKHPSLWKQDSLAPYVLVSHGERDRSLEISTIISKMRQGFDTLGKKHEYMINTYRSDDVRLWAKLIKSDPSYKKGQPVVLMSCFGGGKKFAQRLANKLKVTVYSPNGPIEITETGVLNMPWQNTALKAYEPQYFRKQNKK